MIFFLSLREGFFQGKNTASDENKIFKKKKKGKETFTLPESPCQVAILIFQSHLLLLPSCPQLCSQFLLCVCARMRACVREMNTWFLPIWCLSLLCSSSSSSLSSVTDTAPHCWAMWIDGFDLTLDNRGGQVSQDIWIEQFISVVTLTW